MGMFGGGHRIFNSETQSSFDVNSAGVSDVWDVSGFKRAAVQVEQASGAFSTAVIQVQCSADGVTFYDISGKSVTGSGMIRGILVEVEFLRVRVSTVEGVAGTAVITVNMKG